MLAWIRVHPACMAEVKRIEKAAEHSAQNMEGRFPLLSKCRCTAIFGSVCYLKYSLSLAETVLADTCWTAPASSGLDALSCSVVALPASRWGGLTCDAPATY